MTDIDKNCLSYWFPKIRDAGLPTPKTQVLHTESPLTQLLDGVMPPGFEGFEYAIKEAAAEIGYPCFLRTGHTSGKHDWKDTCYVAAESDLIAHVMRLIEYSQMVDIFGLPCDVWAIRELLPVDYEMTAFRDMPICKEFRCFVNNEQVLCHHPYWPLQALELGLRSRPHDFSAKYERICSLRNEERCAILDLASEAGKAVEGKWSVDLLHTRQGWYIIDMALAERSYHWSGCAHAP